jgi:hypothetical protein
MTLTRAYSMRAEAKIGYDIEAGELLAGHHDLVRHAISQDDGGGRHAIWVRRDAASPARPLAVAVEVLP